MPEIGATRESIEGLDFEGQSLRWWGCVAVTFPITRMRMRLRKRQIASAVTVAAAAAVLVVVVVVDGVGVSGCIASASALEVHVLPGQERGRLTTHGGRTN